MRDGCLLHSMTFLYVHTLGSCWRSPDYLCKLVMVVLGYWSKNRGEKKNCNNDTCILFIKQFVRRKSVWWNHQSCSWGIYCETVCFRSDVVWILICAMCFIGAAAFSNSGKKLLMFFKCLWLFDNADIEQRKNLVTYADNTKDCDNNFSKLLN